MAVFCKTKIAKMKVLLTPWIFILYFAIDLTDARKHTLKIDTGDDRRYIDLSTFGFFKRGYLSVNMEEFSFILPGDGKKPPNNVFGFSLDKTNNNGISPYLEDKSSSCIFNDQSMASDKGLSIVYFMMDFDKNILRIVRKDDDVANLTITTLSPEEFHGKKAYIFSKRNRRAAKGGKQGGRKSINATQSTTVNPVITTVVTVDKNVNSTMPVGVDVTSGTPAKTTQTDYTDWKIVRDDTIKMTRKEVNGQLHYSANFLVIIRDDKEEGLYSLYFHNCYAEGSMRAFVNLTVALEENNDGNYLSAGQMPLPLLYIVMAGVYFAMGCLWLYVLRTSTSGIFKTHYLMLVLVYFKSIALIFHSINFYFIQIEGRSEEAFAILYYITHLMKGALLFITIVLIGAGWSFVKYVLSDRDKKIFLIVIPLQILANVAQIIIDETEEGQRQYKMWGEIFILVDLICCGAILFPVVWSIRHLQEASQTDGKAAINLLKLKIFRHFYIMIVCYIYFTRIIVYLMRVTVPFEYQWFDELFREAATVIFFFMTGYKFRPASNNPYLQLPTEEEDVEMDEVLTQSGAYDNLTKVNMKFVEEDEEEEQFTSPALGGASTTTSKRESSHDYD